MNEKHAYLIMAHNQFLILEKLIRLLDYEENDIYIHIDKKVKDFDFSYYQNIPKKSQLFFVKRINTIWGDYSLIETELTLLKTATRKNYVYYHLLSGVDLPLKSQKEIHQFFKKNNRKEFIHFAQKNHTHNFSFRIKSRHFMRWKRSKNKVLKFCGDLIDLGYKLNKNKFLDSNITLMSGSNWFSITNDLANYIVSKEKWIEKMFKYSQCGDEFFIQTLVYNSLFKENLYNKNFDNDYNSCLRYIDWERGNPYIFRLDDYNELIHNDFLFARKFDIDIDKKIIEEIEQTILSKI